jgi:hypothetical protein
MLTKVSKTHETFFAGTVFEVTGYFNSRYANLQQYFNLKEANQKLAEENTRLRNALGSNFISPDTSSHSFYRFQFCRYTWKKKKIHLSPSKSDRQFLHFTKQLFDA